MEDLDSVRSKSDEAASGGSRGGKGLSVSERGVDSTAFKRSTRCERLFFGFKEEPRMLIDFMDPDVCTFAAVSRILPKNEGESSCTPFTELVPIFAMV